MNATALRTILVVDDSLPVRRRLVDLIEDLPGVAVVGEAEDESEAIDLYRRFSPDVAILDIGLRSGSGIRVLEYIRLGGRKCQVIMLTNFGDTGFREQCVRSGADHFFLKSSEFSQVLDLLRSSGVAQ
ncbi:MAG: response regulator transcription factor [Verrucomicrobia bacterium]|nr:response regulator transcription factor [Verrucomicrobiota bacterium]